MTDEGAADGSCVPVSAPAFLKILSSGKYNRLVPCRDSISTLVTLPYTCCIASRYIRSRVTCGAFWYSANTDEKRCASPCPLRLGDDTRLVRIGLFAQPRRRPDGARNHVIGVGLGFVLGAFALLRGLEH